MQDECKDIGAGQEMAVLLTKWGFLAAKTHSFVCFEFGQPGA